MGLVRIQTRTPPIFLTNTAVEVRSREAGRIGTIGQVRMHTVLAFRKTACCEWGVRKVRITDDCEFVRICESGLGGEPGSQVAGEQVSKISTAALAHCEVGCVRYEFGSIHCELVRIAKYKHRMHTSCGTCGIMNIAAYE